MTLKISAHSVDHIKDCDIFDTFAIKKYWHGTALSIVTFNTEVSELHNDNFGLDPFDLVVFGCPLQVPTHSDKHINNCDIMDNFAIKKDLVVCGCPLPLSGNFYGNQFFQCCSLQAMYYGENDCVLQLMRKWANYLQLLLLVIAC